MLDADYRTFTFIQRVFQIIPRYQKRYFWGGKLCTQSYFVETIGNATEDTIRKYVQNQLIELDKKEELGSQLGLF